MRGPGTGEFPSQRSVTRGFGVFCDLRLNKPLSKQSIRWWFDTPSCSLWRRCNVKTTPTNHLAAFVRRWLLHTYAIYKRGRCKRYWLSHGLGVFCKNEGTCFQFFRTSNHWNMSRGVCVWQCESSKQIFKLNLHCIVFINFNHTSCSQTLNFHCYLKWQTNIETQSWAMLTKWCTNSATHRLSAKWNSKFKARSSWSTRSTG